MASALPLLALLLPLSGAAQIIFPSAQTLPVSPPPVNTPAEKRCVLQGRVTNSVTGEPVRKATVHLRRSRPGSPGAMPASAGRQGYATRSGEDGSFLFEGIEPGEYTLSGQRYGYLNTQYGAKLPQHSGASITLQPGEQKKDVQLALFPQAVISGKVVDEDGDPAYGAFVQATSRTWLRGKIRYMPHGGTMVNDLGEYRIANLPPGKYYVSVQQHQRMIGDEMMATSAKPDIRPIRTFYPEATTLESATPIEVKAGQEMSGIDIRFRSGQTYHVRGKVVGDLAGPDSGRFSIILTPREQGPFGTSNQAMVQKDRTFDLAGVPPGSYELNVLSFGTAGGMRSNTRQPVEVGESDLNDVVVAIVPPGAIHGQVRIEGTAQPSVTPSTLTGVHVTLAPSDGTIFGPPSQAGAKADGTFAMASVSPGKYDVRINGIPEGAYLKSVRLNQEDVLGKNLDLSQNPSGELDILLQYGAGEVDGTVQAAQNPPGASNSSSPQTAPRGDASVLLVPDTLNEDGSGMHFSRTNQDGAFTIKGLAPGHYRAYAFEETNTGELQNQEILKQFESEGADIDVKENDKKQVQIPLISNDELQQALARLGIDVE